ncbi:hypothetical protein OG539_37870 [Actinacidiphila glaucinigra]|uniref:hypothetical protein n=1 Tax=Actinacidiphila glaucinigra TaxID=235986 RepID=UPI0032509914
MDDLLGCLILAAVLAVIMGAFAWLARVIRRRGVAGHAVAAALASYEEAFRVTSYEAHQEIRVQAGRKLPLESPDDPWRPARPALAARPAARSARGPRRSVRRLRRRR